MKYGNIIFDGNRKGSVNIGDDLQLVAVENIYNHMGISQDRIVRVKLSELSTYDGEYCILPISFPLYGYRNETYITMFSPKIIPVFLALSIMSGNISEEECNYLRHYEPIGCRDYHTVKLLRNRGILAYLNGCLSAALPRRENLSGEKVYLVDIPRDYYNYIPEALREDAIVTSQVVDNCNNPEEEIKKKLDEYAKNASLIITTRLHCAMPCVAMGIPVILMKDKYSFRFPFISRYIHVYEKAEFNDIDWNPKSIEYEDIKKQIISLAQDRIKMTYDKYSQMFNLSWFYEENNIREDYFIEHFDNVREYIDLHFNKDESFTYAIWGITQKADMICSYIEHNYPKASFCYAYDMKKRILFHGVQSGNDIEEICKRDLFVFVTTATANLVAMDLFEKCGKKNFHISDDGIERIGYNKV